jgi:TolB-like protein/DNA-binding winged helix-turn-helix (wHTH) protein
MSPVHEPVGSMRFGSFEVDVAGRELRKNGTRIKLQEQPFEVLLLLLQKPGQIVAREELRQRLWPQDTFVDFDNSVNSAISRVREALRDSADTPRFVETVPRHGYRFIAPVENLPGSATPQETRQQIAVVSGVRKARSLWVLAAIALLVTVATVIVWRAGRTGHGVPPRIMLAVLPLENLSGDQEQQYLADSLTEEVITELGRLDPNHLGVIARSSVTQFKGGKKPVSAIGKELGVAYLVEGGVRMANRRLRLNLQLIRVSDQSHVWAQSYERNLEDVLTVERELAEQTAHTISLELVPQVRQRLASRRAVSGQTIEAFLKGRYYISRLDRQAAFRAVEYLEEATRLSPDFAPAYAALADAYFKLGQPLGPNTAEEAREYFSRSEAAARKALTLDDSLAEAHVSLGQAILFRDWDWAASQGEMQRALELAPNSVATLRPYSAQLTMRGLHEASRQTMRRALELDPFNPVTGTVAAELLLYGGAYDQAELEVRRVLAMDPAYKRAHLMLAWLHDLRSQGEQAANEYLKAGMLTSEQAASLARAFRTEGMSGFHTWLLNALQQGGIQVGKARAFHLAIRYASLGNREQALYFLNEAIRQHDSNLLLCKVNPWLGPLHSDPRFQTLLRRIGIPD